MAVMWLSSWKNMRLSSRCFQETRGEVDSTQVGTSTDLRTQFGSMSTVTSNNCPKEPATKKKYSWWKNSNLKSTNVTTAFHWLGLISGSSTQLCSINLTSCHQDLLTTETSKSCWSLNRTTIYNQKITWLIKTSTMCQNLCFTFSKVLMGVVQPS